MKKADINRFSLLITSFLFALIGCREEFHPLTPPDSGSGSGSNVSCKAPSIEKNIIGTWHFASTYNSTVKMREGTITFNADKKIIDPDSLFENEFDVGNYIDRVISKEYNPSFYRDLSDYSGYTFDVHLRTKESSQTNFFIVLNNDCRKIVMVVPGVNSSRLKITLTR